MLKIPRRKSQKIFLEIIPSDLQNSFQDLLSVKIIKIALGVRSKEFLWAKWCVEPFLVYSSLPTVAETPVGFLEERFLEGEK